MHPIVEDFSKFGIYFAILFAATIYVQIFQLKAMMIPLLMTYNCNHNDYFYHHLSFVSATYDNEVNNNENTGSNNVIVFLAYCGNLGQYWHG